MVTFSWGVKEVKEVIVRFAHWKLKTNVLLEVMVNVIVIVMVNGYFFLGS